MKKIISLFLTLVLLVLSVSALAACGGGDVDSGAEDQMRYLNAMFETLVPSQSVTTTTQKIGSLTLTSVATLTIGSVDGKSAATYVNVYEQLADLDGSTNANLVQKKTQKLWYVEGKGLCKNGNGKWIADGEDFRPKAGDVKLSLSKDMFKTAEYDAETETFVGTVDRTGANKLLRRFLMEDQSISSGLTIEIRTAGGRIVFLKLEYTVPAHDIYIGEEGKEDEATDADYVTIDESTVTVEAHYSYDITEITLK